MPRGPRLDATGAVHHVMVRGIERREIFRSDRDRADLLDRLGAVAAETGTALYAWSLLPNHFHLLLRTGATPLSRIMHRALTGYAISFNRRHRRSGHLLQNRFKSILVDEEAYLLELVRYLHLNPLRARLVTTLTELDRYRWSGHAVLLGHGAYAAQDVDFVLAQFATQAGPARRAYRAFVAAGLDHGRREELTGGGLRRSLGGWEAVEPLRRGRERWAFDERVLGCDQFVAELRVRIEAERPRPRPKPRASALDAVVGKVAARFGVPASEITGRSLRREAVAARAVVSCLAVQHLGFSARAAGRMLGLSDDSILRGLRAGKRVIAQTACMLEDFLP